MTVSATTDAEDEDDDESPLRLPVSVLTGFLGSGKTTLLAHLVRQPEMAQVACIINELGDISLDHLLVATSSEDTVVLESGCVCCTVRNDLVETMASLFMRRMRGEIPAFDRIVIETTGLADPAPILHTLISNPLVAARYRLDGVIATVDAIHGQSQLDRYTECLKQIAMADRLVVTKSDLAEPETTTGLVHRLRCLNPAAPIQFAAHGRLAAASLFNAGLYNAETKMPEVVRWLNDAAYLSEPACTLEHDHDHDHEHCHHGASGHHGHRTAGRHDHDHDRRIAAFCLIVDQPMPWQGFLDFIDALIERHGEQMLRLKGLINIRESRVPLVIHGVQHLFHPVVPLNGWPSEDHRSKLVLITRDLCQSTVESLLQAHVAAANAQPS